MNYVLQQILNAMMQIVDNAPLINTAKRRMVNFPALVIELLG